MERNKVLVMAGLVVAVIALGAVMTKIFLSIPQLRSVNDSVSPFVSILPKNGVDAGVAKFSSAEEFRQYLSQSQSSGNGAFGGGRAQAFGMAESAVAPSAKDSAGMSFSNPLSMSTASSGSSGQTGLRVSETNVRTEGMDEPDIVKTDGSHIYYSRPAQYYYRGGPIMLQNDVPASSGSAIPVDSQKIGIVPPTPTPVPTSTTDIFLTSGTGEAALLGTIGRTGETLLYGDTLVLFESTGQNILGYDITDRKHPKEKWNITVGSDSSILEARKSGNKLYLVERTGVNISAPCPIRPMTSGTNVSEIACTDIYRPGVVASADSVFTALYVDPSTGSVGDTVSFVGSSGQSVAYVSADSLFVTYPLPTDPVAIMLGFFRENGDLLSADFRTRLEKLAGYDIGADAKSMELARLLQNEMLGKSQDEQLRLQTEMENRMTDYGKKHLRDFGSTGIVKIALSDFSVKANGSVPGTPLNDYSLDEQDGNLRIATTSGGNGGGYFMMSGNVQSENDVYVLDKSLKKSGELTGLGAGERIYSARFIGDRGYLVTFKQTDPFYVLDLSDPTHPKQTGELKIPGYSSYLHPLGTHLVLGIGRDQNKVKLSLFDVADPANPVEISKYLLDEYWSEATDDHRAFLADPKHQVFFLPGSQGGYVISYAGNALSLKKAIAGQGVRRAIFVGDTLYVIGDSAISSYNENTWEKQGETGIR